MSLHIIWKTIIHDKTSQNKDYHNFNDRITPRTTTFIISTKSNHNIYNRRLIKKSRAPIFNYLIIQRKIGHENSWRTATSSEHTTRNAELHPMNLIPTLHINSIGLVIAYIHTINVCPKNNLKPSVIFKAGKMNALLVDKYRLTTSNHCITK